MSISLKEIVKDPEWQKIRKELIGKWNNSPKLCCSKLSTFLGNISSTSDDKLRIVMNYLTGSGFRMGKIKHSCVQNIRNDISNEMKNRKLKKHYENKL